MFPFLLGGVLKAFWWFGGQATALHDLRMFWFSVVRLVLAAFMTFRIRAVGKNIFYDLCCHVFCRGYEGVALTTLQSLKVVDVLSPIPFCFVMHTSFT